MLKKKFNSDLPDFKKRFLAKKTRLLSQTNSSGVFYRCIFCEKCPKSKDFLSMINKALYVKFAASQNYYYCKDVSEILSSTRNRYAIRFKDQQCFDDEDEFLKRFYENREINSKITILTEYYKYHRDVPRIFMLSIAKIMNYYHDKKRKIEYIRITKIIKEKNEQDQQKKSKKEKNLNDGCLLDDKNERNQGMNAVVAPLKNNYLKILDDIDLTEEKQQTLETKNSNQNNISGVSTVIELQKKLGAIINTKLCNDKSELYTNNEESFGNRFNNSSFLKFILKIEKNSQPIEMKTSNKFKNPSLEKQKNGTPAKTTHPEKIKKNPVQNSKPHNEKSNPVIEKKGKVNDHSFKQKDFLIKEKENSNLSGKNLANTTNSPNFKAEIPPSFLPLKKTEKLLRKVSSIRKSADLNYLDKNNLGNKNIVNQKANNNYDLYCQTEGNIEDLKLEIKPFHTRIFSTVENSLKTSKYNGTIINNYSSKIRLLKTNSLTKKNIPTNVTNTSKNISNTGQDDKRNTEQQKKPPQQHKYTKSDANIGKIMNMGSPKSNKELKYFYKAKNLNTQRSLGGKILNVCISTKNTSDTKSNDELISSHLISPKLNPLDSLKERENSSSLNFK